MSDIESLSSAASSAYNSDDEEFQGGAAKKKLVKNANAAAPVATKPKKMESAAAAEDSGVEEDDDDDDDDESSAAANSAAEDDDDDNTVADDDDDDDDEPFDGADADDSDGEGVAGRNIPARFELNEEENEDDDENDYMEKFDQKTRKNIIQQYYPELIEQSYEEIEVLTKIIRDKDGFIVDPLHQTIPILSKYEKTRILGERARQLGTGAPSLIEVDEDIIDPYLIALKELEAKKIPFVLKRPIPNGAVEYWKIADLEVI